MNIGSLFSGYGGLDMGVQAVLGGDIVWHSDIDKGSCKLLAHRFPGIPNLGDISAVQWVPVCGAYEFEGCGQPAEVLPDRSGWQCNRCQKLWPISLGKVYWPEVPEPVDVLTGGFPCQDVSNAGKQAGLMHGTRSGLWHEFARAIRELRPSLVVIENVRGLLSARGDTSEEYEAADNRVRLIDNLRVWVDDRRTRALNEGRADDAQHLTTRAHRLLGLRRRAVAARRRAERRIVRAIGTVLGTLADLGYDASWYGLRAAEVGAPHGRFRVFIAAYPQGDTGRLGDRDRGAAAYPQRGGRRGWTPDTLGQQVGRVAAPGSGEGALLPTPSCSDTNGAGTHGDGGLDLRTAVASLLPTPRASDGVKGGPNQRGSSGDLMLPSTPTTQDGANNGGPSQHDRNSVPLNAIGALLPTPAVNDMGEGKTPEAWDAWTDRMKAEHGNGNGHGASLAIEAQRLLPTPMVGSTAPEAHGQISGQWRDQMADAMTRWGDYAPAIARWEALTRPAPAPTMTSTKGNPQLAPAFVEWMMGLPAGWITDVPGLSRNDMLKLLGNGVVPAQAAAALRILLNRAEVVAA